MLKPSANKKNNNFSLSVGIWQDYKIDAKDLRVKAWSRNK